MTTAALTRRHFLKVSTLASGGLLIGVYLPDSSAASIQPQPWTALPQGAEINAWLAIDAEGNVTIRVPHTEMGQGALTSVSMMIAEELNVDWTRVRAVFADPNRHLRNNNEYTTMFTAGSALVRRQHPHIMQAGASARERLKEAAARACGSLAVCRTEDPRVACSIPVLAATFKTMTSANLRSSQLAASVNSSWLLCAQFAQIAS